jgi:hypothetical protein
MNRCGVAPKQNAGNDQPDQRRNLARGEDILNHLAVVQAARIAPCEQQYDEHSHQLRGRKGNCVTGCHVHGFDNVVRFSDRQPQYAEKPRETNRDGRNSSRLNDEKKSPAIQESQSRRKRFT